MSKKKKAMKVKMNKAFASEFGIEGILVKNLYRINVIAERKKRLKELKKSKKFKNKLKESRDNE